MWTCRVCPVDQQIYNSTSSSDPKERDENTRNKTVDSAEGPNLRKKNKKEKRSSERKKKKANGTYENRAGGYCTKSSGLEIYTSLVRRIIIKKNTVVAVAMRKTTIRKQSKTDKQKKKRQPDTTCFYPSLLLWRLQRSTKCPAALSSYHKYLCTLSGGHVCSGRTFFLCLFVFCLVVFFSLEPIGSTLLLCDTSGCLQRKVSTAKREVYHRALHQKKRGANVVDVRVHL